VLQFKATELDEPTRRAEYLVKWAGVIVPPKPGRYRLVALTGDPVRVRVNERAVIDNTSGKSTATNATVYLADQPNPLVVEVLMPNAAQHGMSLVWSRPGSHDQELIPAEFLFHPKQR
jgi:PA14 domain